MKIALITDIHANREAFEACMEQAHLHGAQRVAFLGDFVGYGADPAWVVDRVMELVATSGAIAVRGNHDHATAIGARPGMVEDAAKVINWTRSQLNPDQLRFLEELPLVREDGECLFAHANAYAPSEWGYILARADAVRSMMATQARYTFCGHVHEPQLYNLAGTGKIGDFTPTAGVAIPVPPHRQWLILPGSAGQPRDGNPAASFVMFDTDKNEITWCRAPYDIADAADRIRANGLPPWLADRLFRGI